MIDSISFCVMGEPKGKGRPRFTRSGHAYTPKDTIEYENRIRQAYRMADAPMLTGSIGIGIKAYYGIPKSRSNRIKAEMAEGKIRPTKKPDADNVIKVIADALNGIAYHDDSQIVEAHLEKWYADEPRIEVMLSTIAGKEDI
jgi:Holliday junction resolvase RusA-like endonuclease